MLDPQTDITAQHTLLGYDVWRRPWLYAHDGWRQAYPWLNAPHIASIPPALIIANLNNREQLETAQHREPSEAQADVLRRIAGLAQPPRTQLLMLIGEVISPGSIRNQQHNQQRDAPREHTLVHEHQHHVWCQRIHAGLRIHAPRERHSAHSLGLFALYRWQRDAWQHLRWLFNPDDIDASERYIAAPDSQHASPLNLSAKVCDALCHAVLWKIQHHTQATRTSHGEANE